MVIEENPYARLGLMPGSAPAEIKRRYRQLAKQYHPDRNGQDPGSEEKLRSINAAYSFLSDPARKADYDTLFSAAFNPARAPQPVPAAWPAAAPASRSYRRRHESLSAAAGLAMLVLISTGVGVLFTAANASPTFTEMFAPASRTAGVGTDRTPPAYSFVPAQSTFSDPSSPSAWDETVQP